ncbi:MAG: hypothetical protein JW862_12630 [Anaerolineales bacterium]|nr:hypothetical protein [Anaerolineales bacterium]
MTLLSSHGKIHCHFTGARDTWKYDRDIWNWFVPQRHGQFLPAQLTTKQTKWFGANITGVSRRMNIKRFGLLLGLLVGVFFLVGQIDVNAKVQPGSPEDDGQYQVLLPLVRANYPLPMSVFGVEINPKLVDIVSPKLVSTKVSWVRYHGIHWNDVQVEQGVIDWTELELFETEVLQLSKLGTTPMVIIHGTPTWARVPEHPDHICGPIRQDALDDFAEFLTEIVSRYSKPPFNVHYWELGNEPDVDPDYIPADFVFGCWGDDTDPYFGGEYYAEMLKVAYPAIKAADPNARVILGGLLLDCDPANPPKSYACSSGKFLEGVFMNGGADFVDIIAYHAYPFWLGETNVDWDLAYPKWQARGGILLGKLELIREVMAQYGVQKPILMNEGGLMCGYETTDSDNYADCTSEAFAGIQANHLVRMYIRTWANGIDGAAWYTLNGPGWREGGLIGRKQQPRLSYYALEFLSEKLHNGRYSHQISSADLEGYEFFDIENHGTRYQWYWSNSSTTYQVEVPDGTVVIYNRYGDVLPAVGGQISVGFDPILLEITP